MKWETLLNKNSIKLEFQRTRRGIGDRARKGAHQLILAEHVGETKVCDLDAGVLFQQESIF